LPINVFAFTTYLKIGGLKQRTITYGRRSRDKVKNYWPRSSILTQRSKVEFVLSGMTLIIYATPSRLLVDVGWTVSPATAFRRPWYVLLASDWSN